MRDKYKWIFFLIGAAGLVVMLVSTGITKSDIATLLSPATIKSLALQSIIWLAIYASHTVAQNIILTGRAKSKDFPHIFGVTITALALNSVTPAGLIGGEPYRILELKQKYGTKKAIAGTLTLTVFYGAAHVFLWLTGIIIYIAYGCPGGKAISIALITLGILIAFAAGWFVKEHERGFLTPIIKLLMRFKSIEKLLLKIDGDIIEKSENIDSNIVEFSQNRTLFYKLLLIEYFARILQSLEYYVIIQGLGVDITILQAILVASISTLLGNLFFIIPMQIGTHDGGLILSLAWMGVSGIIGTKAVILNRMRDIIFILIGILLILVNRRETWVQKEKY